MNVPLDATVLLIVGLGLWTAIWFKRTRDRHRLEQSSITPEALYALMQANPRLKIFDVRQPLDLLADSEIIPGAQRIAPKEVMANPDTSSPRKKICCLLYLPQRQDQPADLRSGAGA